MARRRTGLVAVGRALALLLVVSGGCPQPERGPDFGLFCGTIPLLPPDEESTLLSFGVADRAAAADASVEGPAEEPEIAEPCGDLAPGWALETVESFDGFINAPRPSAAFDDEGVLHVGYATIGALRHAAVGRGAWSAETVAVAEVAEVALAAGPGRALDMAWVDYPRGPIHASRGAEGWTEEVVAPVPQSRAPCLTRGPSGRLLIGAFVWNGEGEDRDDYGFVLFREEDDGFGVTVLRTGSGYASECSVAVDPFDTAHAAFAGSSLFYASGGPGTFEVAELTWEGQYCSTVVRFDGTVAIATARISRGLLLAEGTMDQGFRLRLVDSDAARPAYPSAGLGPGGELLVAEARCEGVALLTETDDGWEVEQVTAPGEVGPPALAVGPDGTPHVLFVTGEPGGPSRLRHASRCGEGCPEP